MCITIMGTVYKKSHMDGLENNVNIKAKTQRPM